MSDDFDNDDFSWLRDDNEDDTPQDDEDALDFDWQPDENEPSESSGRLGVTGDLPWMQGDADAGEGEDRSDRLGMTGELPWMQDDTSDRGTGERGEHLGMTGELPWMQGDNAAGETPETEEDLSWLYDADIESSERQSPEPEQPTPPDASSEVDVPEWLRDDLPDMPPAAPPEGSEDDEGWLAEAVRMFGSEDDEEGESGPSEPAIPDWLNATDSSDVEAESPEEPVAAGPTEEVPDWLNVDTSDFVAEEPASQEPEAPGEEMPDWIKADTSQLENDPLNEVPDWLVGLDAEEAAQAGPSRFVDETGELSAEWLAQGEALPDHVESELTYDEWLAQQLEAEREPEIDELVPDEFAELDSDEPVEVDTGVLPDWFLGMEELDTSEAPDWFLEETPPTGALEPTGTPEEEALDDFFSSLDSDDAPEPEQPAANLDDFFAEMPGEPAHSAEEALDAFFGPDDSMDTGFEAAEPDAENIEEPTIEPSSLFDEIPETEQSEEWPQLSDEEAPQIEGEGDFGEYDFDEEAAEEPAAEPAYSLFGEESEPEDQQAWDDEEPEFEWSTDADDEDNVPEPSLSDFGDDFLGSLGIRDEAPEEEMPPEAGPVPEPLDESFFASLGLANDDEAETIEAAGEPEAEPLHEADLDTGFFASLAPDESDEAQEDVPEFDWFDEEEGAPEATQDIDWLSELPDLSPGEEVLVEDPLAGIQFGDDEEDEEDAVTAAEMSDIDSILASIDERGTSLPDTSELVDQEVDLETLLSDPAFADVELGEDPNKPDWLTEVGASVGAVSATALLRQQRDRPLEELPDRLRRLRDRGDEVADAAPATESSDVLQNILPGVADALAPGTFDMEDIGVANAVTITDSQNRRVDLLRSLVGQAPAARIGDAVDTAALSAAPAREGRRIKLDRLLVTLIVAAAVILPFFIPALRMGSLPPASFAAGSEQEAFYDSIATLNPGDLVLVGLEYGPTAAGELDSLATITLQHILRQGAVPVIVSGNPVALLRAENILGVPTFSESLGRPLSANRDYFVARYLPGAGLGLRSLVTNPSTTLAFDSSGAETGLTAVNDLNLFARLVVIVESPEDFRNWAEQVAPSAPRVPFLAGSGRAASPLVMSYLGASLDGLLVGYQDALTYDRLLGSMPPLLLDTATPTLEPTATFTPTPEISPTPSQVPPTATETPLTTGVISAFTAINMREGPGAGFPIIQSLQPGTEVEVLSTDNGWINIRLSDDTEGWVAENLITTATPEGGISAPTATTGPSDTPAPTATQTSTPLPTATSTTASTATPERAIVSTTAAPATSTQEDADTATPAPTDTPVPTEITGRVVADTPVNIRSGPGTNFAPVGVASPGDEFVVVGRNGTGDWIRIEFEGAEEAWIAAFLLDISAEQVPEADTSSLLPVRGQRLVFVPYRAQVDPSPTPEITPTEVEADTTTVEVASIIPYANERWYGMTLGLVAIIAIIVLGALVNIGRSLLRRRG